MSQSRALHDQTVKTVPVAALDLVFGSIQRKNPIEGEIVGLGNGSLGQIGPAPGRREAAERWAAVVLERYLSPQMVVVSMGVYLTLMEYENLTQVDANFGVEGILGQVTWRGVQREVSGRNR